MHTMQRRQLGSTDISIAPLVFGGNVFSWTVDERTAFDLLDRFVAAGFDAIDTAEMYTAWVPGHSGGESEAIIGNWMAARGNRDDVVVMTKVGAPLDGGRTGLSRRRIVDACNASLQRLRTDRIDVYFSHYPDENTPEEETLRAYESLIEQGKVRAIGCSNYDAAQLRHALDESVEKELPRYEVVQPEYNLYTRQKFEGPLRDLCVAERLGVVVYYSLAAGFLTGKYRSEADFGKSQRGGNMKKYLDARGLALLDAMDDIAARHGATPAEVAIAWLMQRDGVTAPIASATSVAQLDSLIRAARLRLSAEDLAALD